MEKSYRVKGVTCQGCATSVTRAFESLSPKLEADVSVEQGTVRIRGEHDEAVVKKAIEDAGFEFLGAA